MICSKLFKKLSDTADFLQSLLADFGATEKGQHLIDEINESRTDHDHSLSLAFEINAKIREAEESANNLKMCLERIVSGYSADEDAKISLKSRLLDSVFEKEMNEKLMIFEHCDITSSSSRLFEPVNVTATDLLNRSLVLREDLINMKAKATLFKSTCSKLFAKLNGTADFLQSLLTEFDATEKSQRLLDEMSELRIDLHRSLSLAFEISEKIEETEKNVSDFKIYLERTCPLSEIQPNSQEFSDISDQQLMTEFADMKNFLNEKEFPLLRTEESLKNQCISSENQSQCASHQKIPSLKQLTENCMVDEIKGLKEELHRVSDSVKANEENRKKAEATCVLLLREKQEFETEIVKYRDIIKSLERQRSSCSSIQVQTEMNIGWISSLEADYQKLLLINICEQENIKRLTHCLLEKKKKLSEQNCAINAKLENSTNQFSGIICTEIGVLTEITGEELERKNEYMLSYSSFITNLYEFTSRWLYGSAICRTDHGTFIKKHGRPSSLKQSEYLISVLPVAAKFTELDIQKELSYISFERMSDSAHFLVHIFKKLIQHGDKSADLNLALNMARSLRSQLYILWKCSGNAESIKENVASFSEIGSLKEQNVRLQLALNDATELLKIAEEKLKFQPESKVVVCDRIAQEMSKIHEVLKDGSKIFRSFKKKAPISK
ncbi:unnamed protein product [Dracunculus medinensis]|uniref:Uncharacterized protein n=1 Tax=Dracunculus medinensis TaxID=318479 RepID=A0A3P7PXD4_DRAME|nr:unnamed protein product [Dracunculus medinensis]